jgi:uncharacterized membrane protein YfcA
MLFANIHFIEGFGLIFAGIVQGVTGFGIGLVAVGLLTIYHPPVVVIPALLGVYIVTSSILLYENRGYFNKKLLENNFLISFPSFILALLGMIGGSFLLKTVQSKYLTLMLGIFIILFSFFNLFQKFFGNKIAFNSDSSDKIDKKEKLLCYFATSSSGMLEGLLGLGGPPIVIYTIYQGLNSKMFITLINTFFLGLNPLRFINYLILGLIDWEVLKLGFFILIFVLVGLMLGMLIRRRFIDEGRFKILVVALLIIIGISLIFKSLQ